MEIQQYIIQKVELSNHLLDYLTSDDLENDSNDFQDFINYINDEKIREDHKKLKDLICLLSVIAKNHHRNPHFFHKIKQIIRFLKNDLNQTFSNEELFNFFRKSKDILLFLFQDKILTFNRWVFNYINRQRKVSRLYTNFFCFFFSEIKEFIDESEAKKIEEKLTKKDPNVFNNFEEKRLKGENDSLVLTLIRNDSVEEFISYVSRTNFALTTKIETSIFETNFYLLKNEPTIIEYATFFGSIQIFKYLLLKNVELTSSLWLYAIHSQNSELIHLLELNHVVIDDELAKKCLKESIKCHHNDISNYFLDNYIDEENEKNNFENKFGDNVFDFGFRYHNYSFFPNDFVNDNKFILFYLCKYDYVELVKILFKTQELNFNETIIINLTNFIEFKYNHFMKMKFQFTIKFYKISNSTYLK